MLSELRKMFLQEVPKIYDQDSTETFGNLETLGPKSQNPHNFILKVYRDALMRAVQLHPNFSFNFHL